MKRTARFAAIAIVKLIYSGAVRKLTTQRVLPLIASDQYSQPRNKVIIMAAFKIELNVLIKF